MDVQPISTQLYSFTVSKEDLEKTINEIKKIMQTLDPDSEDYKYYNRKLNEAENPNFQGFTIESSKVAYSCGIPWYFSKATKV